MQYSTQWMIYMVTLALAAVIPGPGMTGLMFKTLAQGYRQGIFMLIGLITGDLIFLLMSLCMLASLLNVIENFITYMMIFSCGYLLYLSYQYWHATGYVWNDPNVAQTSYAWLSYREGLLITLSNPKTISFYLALVPLIFTPHVLQQHLFSVVFTTVAVLMAIGGLYIFGAMGLKKNLRQPKIQRLFLKILALLMGGLALSMLYSAFI